MPPDRPEVLLRKARQDELVLERLLDDQEVDDDTLGFHAQQAVEKLLKAVLASRGVEYPRTHNLRVLVELLGKDSGPSGVFMGRAVNGRRAGRSHLWSGRVLWSGSNQAFERPRANQSGTVSMRPGYPTFALGASRREATPTVTHPIPDREEPGVARADAGESLRLTSNSPVGHPSIL